ncbi:MAG: type IV toxin-antitoxin system AbiEi family antitoxin [Gemmatimonadales bacterium]|nr:type IV toxin-antitoxin system AbiEi family antitoxin [Gemmatimonadales bacterium]
MASLAEIAAQVGSRVRPRDLALRLVRHGWLLPTVSRGTWEFVPGVRAGAYSTNDPWLPLRGHLARGLSDPPRVALLSALWEHGLLDRSPERHEISYRPGVYVPKALGVIYRVTRFSPALPPKLLRGLPVDAEATVLVQVAARPRLVRSWAALLEVLPEVTARVTEAQILAELEGRSFAVRARCGYLLGPYAPHLLSELSSAPGGVTWFGPRGTVRRSDTEWNVVDTILPRSPGHGEDAR